jgi:hypothetical protein
MKKTLTLLLLMAVALGCKKDEETTALTLAGTSWETSFYGRPDDPIHYEKLEFTSRTDVTFYTTFTVSKLMTASGKAKLKYTVEGAETTEPKIHITGKYNSMSGGLGLGATADFTLTYVPNSSDGLPKLAIDATRGYSKVTFN